MGILTNILQSAQAQTAPTGVIGIDVGSSSIKLVELEERDQVLTLLTYGEVQLGPYADQPLGSVAEVSTKQLQAALVDLIRESAAKSRDAVFAMPLSSSFISATTITAKPDADLAPLVRAEARKLIPASLSEVTLDWVELDAPEDATGRPVLLAAIQNSALDSFKILLQFAGFNDAPTEIECFSLNRLVAGEEYTTLIDFGASTTKMYLAHNGILTTMHRTTFGGAEITKALAAELTIPYEEAENLKLNITEGTDEYALLRSLYTKKYSRALREFKQVLHQYQQTTGAEINTVNISGGAASFPALAPIVADSLSAEVSLLSPFDQVAYPAFMEDTMKRIGPTFGPSLGAALRMFY